MFQVTADISNKEQAELAINTLAEKLGTIDILINNASVAKFGTVLEMETEALERIIQTNLMGTYYVTRAALPTVLPIVLPNSQCWDSQNLSCMK